MYHVIDPNVLGTPPFGPVCVHGVPMGPTAHVLVWSGHPAYSGEKELCRLPKPSAGDWCVGEEILRDWCQRRICTKTESSRKCNEWRDPRGIAQVIQFKPSRLNQSIREDSGPSRSINFDNKGSYRPSRHRQWSQSNNWSNSSIKSPIG